MNEPLSGMDSYVRAELHYIPKLPFRIGVQGSKGQNGGVSTIAQGECSAHLQTAEHSVISSVLDQRGPSASCHLFHQVHRNLVQLGVYVQAKWVFFFLWS